MTRFVIGYLGAKAPQGGRKFWNALFQERGIDAFCDSYPTLTRDDVQQRLSEMFLLERRGYMIAPELQPYLPELLDAMPEQGSVDTVVNDGGVLKGYATGGDAETRMTLWLRG